MFSAEYMLGEGWRGAGRDVCSDGMVQCPVLKGVNK